MAANLVDGLLEGYLLEDDSGLHIVAIELKAPVTVGPKVMTPKQRNSDEAEDGGEA